MIRAFLIVAILSISVQASAAQLWFFTQANCPDCDVMRPAVLRLANEGFDVRELKLSTHRNHFDSFGVTITPTFIVFDDQGNQAGRINGITSEASLRALLERADQRTGTPLGFGPSRTVITTCCRRGLLGCVREFKKVEIIQ